MHVCSNISLYFPEGMCLYVGAIINLLECLFISMCFILCACAYMCMQMVFSSKALFQVGRNRGILGWHYDMIITYVPLGRCPAEGGDWQDAKGPSPLL